MRRDFQGWASAKKKKKRQFLFLFLTGGWRVYVHKNEANQLMVTHVKRQRSRSQSKEDEFEFEWRLEITFGENLEIDTISKLNMKVTEIGYGEVINKTKKEQIESILGPYVEKKS